MENPPCLPSSRDGSSWLVRAPSSSELPGSVLPPHSTPAQLLLHSGEKAQGRDPFFLRGVVHGKGWRQGPVPLEAPVEAYSAWHSSPRKPHWALRMALGRWGQVLTKGSHTTLAVGVTQRGGQTTKCDLGV